MAAGNRDSGAAGRLVARAEARRRWAALLGLTVLVAVVVTAVLAVTGGARRTATVVERYLEATEARDYSAFISGLFGAGEEGSLPPADEVLAEVLASLADVDSVDRVAGAIGYPTAASDEFDFTVLSSPDDTLFTTVDRPLLRDGRLPAAGAADEVAVNDSAAGLLGVDVGDVIEAPTFSPSDCEALRSGEQFPGFNGPLLSLRVVGRVLLPDDIRGVEADSSPVGLGSPAFAQRYAGEICATVIFAAVSVGDDDPGPAVLQQRVDDAAAGSELALVASRDDDFAGTARSASGVVTVVLLLVAAIAAIAGTATVAQAMRRQALVSVAAGPTLAALGFTRDQRARAIGAPIAIAVITGTFVGTVGAYLASRWFPVAFSRRLEPSPGLDFDGVTLLAGALVLAVLGTAWAYGVARRAGAAATSGGVPRPSKVAEGAARSGFPPAAVIGLRMAYEGGSVPARVPTRSAVAGVTLGVLGVVAVVTLATTLDDTIGQPLRYGWTWSTMPDIVGDPEATVGALASEERLQAAARLVSGAVELDGSGRVQANAIDDRIGVTSFTLRSGREPQTDGEVALGSAVMDEAGLDIGDEVTAMDGDGNRQALTVVGEAVVPLVNDSVKPGDGAILTAPALTRLVRGEIEEALLLEYRDGTDRVALERDLTELGLGFPGYAYPEAPGRLGNLDGLDGVFVALAGFLALLGAAGLTHALLVSARRHRRSFAALRAVGFVRGQVRLVLLWESAAIAVLAVALGSVLGVVAGRLAWTAVTADLGILEVVTIPVASIGLIAVAVLVGALALALVPAALATRARAAEALRAE